MTQKTNTRIKEKVDLRFSPGINSSKVWRCDVSLSETTTIEKQTEVQYVKNQKATKLYLFYIIIFINYV
jgi:hypothetical protein